MITSIWSRSVGLILYDMIGLSVTCCGIYPKYRDRIFVSVALHFVTTSSVIFPDHLREKYVRSEILNGTNSPNEEGVDLLLIALL